MEQLRAIFRDQGLTVHRHRRRSLHYVYGSWREGEKVKQVYVAPEAHLLDMTSEQVQQKIAEKLTRQKTKK